MRHQTAYAVYSLCALASLPKSFPRDPAYGDFDQLLQVIVNEPDPDGPLSKVKALTQGWIKRELWKRLQDQRHGVDGKPGYAGKALPIPSEMLGNNPFDDAIRSAVMLAAYEASETHRGMTVQVANGDWVWEGFEIRMKQQCYIGWTRGKDGQIRYLSPSRVPENFDPGPVTMLDLMLIEAESWNWLDWFYGEIARQLFVDVFGQRQKPKPYDPKRPPRVITISALLGDRRPSGDDGDDDGEPDVIDPLATAAFAELEVRDWMLSLMSLARLSGEDRTILTAMLAGDSASEISRWLDKTPAAIWKQVERMRAKLVKVIEDEQSSATCQVKSQSSPLEGMDAFKRRRQTVCPPAKTLPETQAEIIASVLEDRMRRFKRTCQAKVQSSPLESRRLPVAVGA